MSEQGYERRTSARGASIPRRTVVRDAFDWIDANPQAWSEMVSAALRSARVGRRFGVKALVEYVRWNVEIETGKPYKVNNNLAPIFARILVGRFPELGPFVSRRESVFDVPMISCSTCANSGTLLCTGDGVKSCRAWTARTVRAGEGE